MLENIRKNKYFEKLWIMLGLTAIVSLLIAGSGVVAALLLVAMVGVSIYFGSIRVLAGSAVLAVLLKTIGSTLKTFIGIWYTGPKLTAFFDFVNASYYTNLILCFFFFFYLISFGTSCIKLFSFANTTNITNKIGDKNEDEEEEK